MKGNSFIDLVQHERWGYSSGDILVPRWCSSFSCGLSSGTFIVGPQIRKSSLFD